jgi:hypothetical protein
LIGVITLHFRWTEAIVSHFVIVLRQNNGFSYIA